MSTLEYIIKKYDIKEDQEYPMTITISRFHGLLRLFKELEFKTGAEIGVSKGRYARALCERIPSLKLYCIDPWEAYDDYIEHHDEAGQIVLNKLFEVAKERLAPYNHEFVKKYSMDAVKDFKDESLDFVFIDGNHSFQYVINDIAEWSKKVRTGGIIAGHDYWNSPDRREWDTKDMTPEDVIKLCQVKAAVDAWTKTNQIKQWFVIDGDKCPSWFWIKE